MSVYLKVFNFYNSTSAKLLQSLRDEIVARNGNVNALKTVCVTRWTSTWLSTAIVLEA